MPQAIRLGILNDISADVSAPSSIEPWLRCAVNELREQQRLDRDVEFIKAAGLGLPNGSAAAVEKAFYALLDQDVLGVVGPAIGDNALVVTPLADAAGVPTINWAGSERARSDFMFQLQIGSHEDEPALIVDSLQRLQAKQIAVVYDRSVIGRRYRLFFERYAAATSLPIGFQQDIPPLADTADAIARQIVQSGADCCVYLGLGEALPVLASALRIMDWQGQGMANTAGIRGYQPGYAEALEGWAYVDMYSDSNTILHELCQRYDVPLQQRLVASRGYDLGRLVAEGLVHAPELTREGFRDGLELTKYLASAEGEAGTRLGFGHYDHGALHGSYLVMRQWNKGVSEQYHLP